MVKNVNLLVKAVIIKALLMNFDKLYFPMTFYIRHVRSHFAAMYVVQKIIIR